MRRFDRIQDLKTWLDGPADGGEPIARLLRGKGDLLELLTLLETTNPCGQSYHVAEQAFLVSYQLPLNLLTFRNRALKIPARIIGLPISLSMSPLLAADEQSGQELVRAVMGQTKGLCVALNLDRPLLGNDRTLSNFSFQNQFDSFDHYLYSLRSSYRRNALGSLRAGAHLVFKPISPQDFSPDHYSLYRRVVGRSDYPLETLPLAFFKGCDCEIVEVRDQAEQLLAVLVLKGSGDRLHFMFCGFDRDDEVRLYQNLLLHIIRKGIEEGYGSIDLGQTSEEAKLRLGALEQFKYLGLHHSNPLLDRLLRPLTSLFSYRGGQTLHQVFRREGQHHD